MTSCRAFKLAVSAPWKRGPQIVLAVTAMMGGGDVGMFFQLTALMFSCFEGVKRARCWRHCHR